MVDFIVDVLDVTESSRGFFFVQVKSTSRASAASRTLKLNIQLNKFNKLAGIPIPTFLIGVDTQSERAFLIAAPKPKRRPFSSITKKHDLDIESVRVTLYKEVVQFWRKNRSRLIKLRTSFDNGR